jgi:predicted murein hydrolase (TIGR00659 family)
MLSNSYFLLALTFVVFVAAMKLSRRTHLIILNPILVTIIVIIGFLLATDVSYESYSQAGSMIDFWLKPAVVSLAVPLYRQLTAIRKQMLFILLAELAGCVAGIVSVVLVAQLLGASRDVVLSLASKSVTTPIAIEITSAVGGIVPITAAVVVCVGIFGGMAGFKVMSMTRVKSPVAQGLSMGTAAHAVGTSMAIDAGGLRYGAWASLGLIINGLFTAILAPTILSLLGV